MAKKIWLGHAPDIAQVDEVTFNETSASVLAESADLIITINGKALSVEPGPESIADLDTAVAGDTYGIKDIFDKMAAAINATIIPEFSEVAASVETLDPDTAALYHRLLLTGRTAGKPFTAAVTAPNPTADVDRIQAGAPGVNEKQSFYITPVPTGGTYTIKWNFGSGTEESGSIAFGGNKDVVHAAMVSGMASVTDLPDIIVTGLGTSASPFIIELIGTLASTAVGLLSIDVSSLTGNGLVSISTLQDGSGPGSGSNVVTDNFTDPNGTLLTAHTADTAQTWSLSEGTSPDIQSNKCNWDGLAADVHVCILSGNTGADFVAKFNSDTTGGEIGSGVIFQHGIVFRHTDTSNYLYACIQHAFLGDEKRFEIHKVEGGIDIILTAEALLGIDLLANASIVLTAQGDTLDWIVTFDSDTTGPDSTISGTTVTAFNQAVLKTGTYFRTNSVNHDVFMDPLTFDAVVTLNEKQSVYTNGAGGTFTLTFGGQTTAGIAPGATAAQLETAYELLSSINDVTVTGNGIPTSPWIIEYVGTDTGNNVAEVTGSGTLLTGGFNFVVVEIQAGSAKLPNIWNVYVSNATGGTVKLKFLGRLTVAIAFGATAATVETALDGLVPGSWTGIFTVTGLGTLASPWIITSSGRIDGVAHVMEADNTLLTGTALGVVHSTIVSATGRHWWNNGVNWRDFDTDAIGIPATGDEVIILTGDETNSILYGLQNSAVKLDRLIISSMFIGTIGLPELVESEQGTYAEYRPSFLEIGFQGNKELSIGTDQGQGSGLIRIDSKADEVFVRVERTDGPAEIGQPAVVWIGSSATNTVLLLEGVMGIATFPFQTAAYTKITQRGGLMQVGEGGACGSGGVDQTGGSIHHQGKVGGNRVILRN